MTKSLGNELLKGEIQELIYIQIITDIEVYLNIVIVITRNLEAKVLEVLEVGL